MRRWLAAGALCALSLLIVAVAVARPTALERPSIAASAAVSPSPQAGCQELPVPPPVAMSTAMINNVPDLSKATIKSEAADGTHLKVIPMDRLSDSQRAERTKVIQRASKWSGGRSPIGAVSLVKATIDHYGQMRDVNSDVGPVKLFVKNKVIWAVQVGPMEAVVPLTRPGRYASASTPPSCYRYMAASLSFLYQENLRLFRTESLTHPG
ncbi:hypothetical protein ACIB24_05775 [Spongisporangium articulatum]|uniref:Uncharacterized protein n=1 Tax=Spongisporangium articulatum TaxID=3362603 RepID=A0ABW8AKP1_9ACTN